jgi:hypothetical protein
MRHVTGIFLAVVTAAVLYGGGGWGAHRIAVLHAHGASLATRPGAEALAVLAATGVLIGIMLVAPRVSPLAPVLPGLTLLAWSAYLVVNARGAYRLVPLPADGAGMGFRALLGGGILALIGAVMVIPLFVPSRWRRRRRGGYDYGDGYGDDGFEQPSATGLLQ